MRRLPNHFTTFENRADNGASYGIGAFGAHSDYLKISPPAQAKTGGGPEQISEPTDQIPGDDSTSYTLTVGGSETGAVNFKGDHDWFSINLVAGQSYVFTMTGSGTLSDTYLELRNDAGSLLAIDDDGIAPGGGSLLRFTATTSGAYFINARAYEEPGVSNVGDYTVTADFGPPQNPLDTIDLHYTAPLHIDVYFATSGESFNGITASRSWTASEQSSAMAALATWAAVTPITFSLNASSAGAEFILSLATLGSGVLGQFSTVGGIGYGDFAPNGFGWTTPGLLPGGAGFTTLIHEFGHGLGLAHPHDNGGGSEIMQGVLGPFGSYGTYLMDQGVFTVMSYNDGWSLKPDGGTVTATAGNEGTPGPLDVALVQIKYGANPSANAGDTAYVLSAAAGPYTAIWDTGGSDTISFAGSAATTIDLRAATLLNEIGGGGFVSRVSGVQGGYTIAHSVVIENAIGGSGADTLIGNDANNNLNGGAGADAMAGGLGDDIYSVDNAGDVVTENANEGVDLVQSSINLALAANIENLTLTGSATNAIGNALDNVLTGSGGANFLSGGVGNDTLNGGAGADAMTGGTGDDTYIVDDAGDVVTENASEGTDSVQSSLTYVLGANVENLTLTGAGAINGTGNDLANNLTGTSAANTLDGGVDADTMIGGAGDDTYIVDNAGDAPTENPGEGTDIVLASITWTLGAALENLTLTGAAAIDGTGNTLNNLLTGNDADNILNGKTGDDVVNAAGGADTLYGGDGNDTLAGGIGVDFLDAGNNNDNLNGGADNDTLYGRAGTDTLDGGLGADTMFGGAGDDTYIVDNAGDVAAESSASGNDTILASVTYGLGAYIENLTLTGVGAINGTGNILANTLTGNDGANVLSGLAGFDTLFGMGGDDTLNGGNGNDTLSGGTGADILDGGNDLDTLNGGDGADTLYGRTAADTLNGDAGADTLYGGDGDDILNGGADNDLLDAGNHNDSLSGGDGDDTLYGRQNDDTLQGDAGADTLYGGDGVDTLNGGAGLDIINGGNGNDTFIFAAGEANGDTLQDFDGLGAAAGDQFVFSGYGLAVNGATFLQLDATHWQINSADGTIHDVITLANGASVDASDYVFGP